MKDTCLDIGIIQAFLDGEIPHDQIAAVSNHVAQCSGCASMLAEAEEESAFVFSALEREMNTLVPTQRLWSRINGAIAVEQESRTFWQKALALVSTSLMSPSFAGAMALVLAVGILSIFMLKGNNIAPTQQVADVRPPATTNTLPAPSVPQATAPVESVRSSDIEDTASFSRPKVERASYEPQNVRRVEVRPAAIRASGQPASANVGMPGEESYVRTIATLAKTVDEQKDSVLRPSERVAYERDMAVVDDTIAKMRQEVKRDPRNVSAKQVLYSSYQNKIDLLNSVSQKQELVASLKR